jgi:hypothetical protein
MRFSHCPPRLNEARIAFTLQQHHSPPLFTNDSTLHRPRPIVGVNRNRDHYCDHRHHHYNLDHLLSLASWRAIASRRASNVSRTIIGMPILTTSASSPDFQDSPRPVPMQHICCFLWVHRVDCAVLSQIAKCGSHMRFRRRRDWPNSTVQCRVGRNSSSHYIKKN